MGKTQFTRVEFQRFKALKSFTLDLKRFNILVGPNNAGKSTILAAFRILAAAMRKASSKKATLVRGPEGRVQGYEIDLSSISVAEENIFYNYDDDDSASVTFRLSNKNSMTLYFPEIGICYLLPDAQGRNFSNPAAFRSEFDCPIGFVPILGPVEHHEPLYEREAARLALFNYRAARNFRNIWYHYPDNFVEFQELLTQTWPGMEIKRPEVDTSHDKPRLHMFCPEKRIPREIFWAGFGFQVWCQMLTHLIQSKDVSLFLIDEPDIYLHSELQRQLVNLLRSLGPDILIATHSTEIVTEAETDDLLLVTKDHQRARRIRTPSELDKIFSILGSSMNPVLTQLAKTRRVVFVEGKDFNIISKYAQKLGASAVANRRDFSVVPVHGFSPERIRNLISGMEATLGAPVLAAAILDRDYRGDEECALISSECQEFCALVQLHSRKEIENFLLLPDALDRAVSQKLADRVRRSGVDRAFTPFAEATLLEFSETKKSYVTSQLLSTRTLFERRQASRIHDATLTEVVLNSLEAKWHDVETRLAALPGKEAFAAINQCAQITYGVSVTATSVISATRTDEVPAEMKALIDNLVEFSKQHPADASPTA